MGGWNDGQMASTPTGVPDPSPELLSRAGAVRRAAMALGQCTDEQRRQALLAMAQALEQDGDTIVAANEADLEAAAADQLAPALVARLKLDGTKLASAIEGVRQLAALPDPVGRRQLHTELDAGLVLERISVPLGVVGVIFEARPDALIQIASLAVRSGNGALLKGDARPAGVAQRSSRLCRRVWRPVRWIRGPSPCSPPARRALGCSGLMAWWI